MTSEAKKTGRAARSTDPDSVARREQLEAWQKEQSNRSVAEILRYRDLRGYSNEELRRRLGALGWDLTKDSLASILASKRKSMPAADLMLFALALNVPPFALTFPVWTNEPVSRWPHDHDPLDGQWAALWATGREADVPLPNELAESDTVDDFYFVADIIVLRAEVLSKLRLTKLDNMMYTVDPSEKNGELLTGAIDELFESWSSLRWRYRGMALPELEPGFAFLNERTLTIPSLPLADVYSPGEEEHFRSLVALRRDARAQRTKSASDAST